MGLLRFAVRKVSPSHDIFEQRAPARHSVHDLQRYLADATTIRWPGASTHRV